MWKKILENLGTLLLSLSLAIIVWFVAVRQQNPPVEGDLLESIPIEVENLPPDKVIFGEMPDKMQLTLRAPQSVWNDMDASDFRAWIDLQGMDVGLHDVTVQVDYANPAIKILQKSPDTVNVRLETLSSKQMPVTIKVLDEAPLGYYRGIPATEPITVTISGPTPSVEKVDRVVAELYIRGSKENVVQSVNLTPLTLEGDAAKWVNVEPGKARVTIPINQRFGYRDVSVRAVITGQVTSGYWVGNISVEPSIVMVVGSPATLNSMSGYVETTEIDVTGATEKISQRVPLVLPAGTSIVMEGGEESNVPSVLVMVDIQAIEGGLTIHRGVTYQGLLESQWAILYPDTVDVILSGPLPKLDALKESEVQVVLDLYGLEPGSHTLKPSVVMPEGIRLKSIVPETLVVEIGTGPTPTPTGMVTSSAAITPTVTPAPK